MKMEATIQTFRREALAAPTDASSIHIQSVVILIVSIASLLGAAWIIVSFIVRLLHFPSYILPDASDALTVS